MKTSVKRITTAKFKEGDNVSIIKSKQQFVVDDFTWSPKFGWRYTVTAGEYTGLIVSEEELELVMPEKPFWLYVCKLNGELCDTFMDDEGYTVKGYRNVENISNYEKLPFPKMVFKYKEPAKRIIFNANEKEEEEEEEDECDCGSVECSICR